jgi:hypothetical protein
MTSFLGNIRPRNHLSCECNLLCDGVNGVVAPDFPVLRLGVGSCGGGEGFQFGVREGVSCRHGDRGGSLIGVSRCGALNGRTTLQGVDSMY